MRRLTVVLALLGLLLSVQGVFAREPYDSAGEQETTVEQPTPTPTSTPTAQPRQTTVHDYIVYWAYYYGRPDLIADLDYVAWRETRQTLYPRDGSAGEVGTFQFHPRGVWLGLRSRYPSEWGWLTFQSLRDPETNVRLAVFAFANGYRHPHWDTAY